MLNTRLGHAWYQAGSTISRDWSRIYLNQANDHQFRSMGLLTRGTREPQISQIPGKDDQLSTMGSWGPKISHPEHHWLSCWSSMSRRIVHSGPPKRRRQCVSIPSPGNSTPSPGMQNRWTMMNDEHKKHNYEHVSKPPVQINQVALDVF